MLTIPDKFEELDFQQKEHFAKLGFNMYKNIEEYALKSKVADELCKTVCKNQNDIFNAMNELSAHCSFE